MRSALIALSISYRLSDFQAQRAAFAILATHLPARNFATLRRIALFFHTTHVHPAVFCRAGIPLENALLRPYWKDSGSGREQMRFDAAAKMYAVTDKLLPGVVAYFIGYLC